AACDRGRRKREISVPCLEAGVHGWMVDEDSCAQILTSREFFAPSEHISRRLQYCAFQFAKNCKDFEREVREKCAQHQPETPVWGTVPPASLSALVASISPVARQARAQDCSDLGGDAGLDR